MSERLSHGDATLRNVLFDPETGNARWFDFDTAHDPGLAPAWRHGDDLRALVYSSVESFADVPVTMLLRTVQDAYQRLTVPHSDRGFGTMIAHPSLGNSLREITIMAKPLLPDELWEIIEPLLPKWTPSPKGGQPPVTDRNALTGILFVLKTGIPWEDLPCEMGCGCGMTCWRRLRDWQADGTWDKIHKVLLDRLRGADKIDWSRALIDSSFVRAAYGGEATGPSPVDRSKPGSKHHVITDANGIPLASSVTAANVNDITEMAPLFNAIPPVAGKVGHPRKKPDALQGDLAYDSEPHRQGLREHGRRADPAREGDRRPGAAWVRPAGRWSGRWPGSTRTGGFGSVMSGDRTSIKRSSPWPASRSVQVLVLRVLLDGLCRPGALGAAPRPAGPGGTAPIATALRPSVSARWAEARAGIALAARRLAVRIAHGRC